MPLVTESAIILQAFAYGETSRILRLLTASHGVRSAIARGALRPRSRYGGILEPFAEGTATLVLRDSRELQTLSAFELTRSPQRLGNNLLRFAGASLLCEIILRTASEERQPGLFQALRTALVRLADADPGNLECLILAEAWTLVARLGFAPRLDACAHCGRDVPPDLDASFDFGAGGVLCDRCATAEPGRRLPAHARAALSHLCQGDFVPLERTSAHWQLLYRYLDHHVLEGAVLRSPAFLERALQP